MTTFASRTLSITVRRPPQQVYDFAADPRNLPRWVGFFRRVSAAGEHWVAETEAGPVRLRFCAGNALGVLDHQVELPSGETVVNPMRVIANGDGSELLFTLFRRAGVSEEAFAADATLVERDLAALRSLLEQP